VNVRRSRRRLTSGLILAIVSTFSQVSTKAGQAQLPAIP
jgi:hypothetical protein